MFSPLRTSENKNLLLSLKIVMKFKEETLKVFMNEMKYYNNKNIYNTGEEIKAGLWSNVSFIHQS